MGGNAWAEHKLGDVMDVKHGFAFPGERIKDTPPGDILLTPGNFAVGGGFKGDKYKYFDGPVPDDYVLYENDLIVTMTDLSKQADTLGFSALVPRPGPTRFLHNQRLGKVLIRDGAEVDKFFLAYLLRTPQYRHEVLAGATGTTVKHTSPNRILAYRASFPPLPEQRAIAQILGTLDDRIELNRRMNETLEAMARALFQSWFVDFDPVHRNIQRAQGHTPPNSHLAEFDALFPDTFENSPLGEIPKGWRTTAVYDIATYINGAAYRAFKPNDDREGLPIIKIAELKAGVTAQTRFSAVKMPEKYLIDSGDILFSWSGNPDTSIDTFVWPHGPAWLNQHIFRVVPPSQDERAFVLMTLRALRPVFAEIARDKQTTGLGHVTATDLKRLQIARPPAPVLATWNTLVEPILARQFGLAIETNTLASLRDALLPKLISGELRVKDAERFVEGGRAK